MQCPYYNVECTSCNVECSLNLKRVPISGRLIIQLRKFRCECGQIIETPVTPCETQGCKHRKRKKSVFKKTTKVGRRKVETTSLPLGGYQTTVIGGGMSGERWISADLPDALEQHESTILLVKAVL